MRIRIALILVKALILTARGFRLLFLVVKKIFAFIARPTGAVFNLFFRVIVVPLYRIYTRVRREVASGDVFIKVFQNRKIHHVFISVVIAFSFVYSIVLRGFAAEDLDSQAPLLVLLEGKKTQEFLIEETSGDDGPVGLGYIPLGFADLDEDDEEIFALIAGGGAFVRPLSPLPPGGAPTRLGIETYIVETGDTISSIANKFGISINTILWANHLSARSLLKVSQKLTVPPTTGVVYVVKRGDTLDIIATKYKGNKETIVAFNNLATPTLQVGQTIVIPDGRVPPPPPPPARPKGAQPTFVPQAVPGKLLWPVGSHRITQYYWWRHPGLDVGAPAGTPIYASDDGIVEFIKYGRTGYGYQIMVDHGNNFRTRYAHASKIFVKPGDQVIKGQVIAHIGSTGRSTGPHIHYEILIGSRRVNPLQYIR